MIAGDCAHALDGHRSFALFTRPAPDAHRPVLRPRLTASGRCSGAIVLNR